MERRKHSRFQQWNKAIIKSASGGEGTLPNCPIDAYAWDLSLGGARIQSEECFPVGAIVRIHLELVRSREAVGVDGVVRWSRRNEKEDIYEFGIEFQECNEIVLQAIMKNLYRETGRKARAVQPQVSLGKGAM
ncbi:MAG: PilZ domain-containing protein [Acidobacteria bacterium]|nr:PilZ domain-containing protein [Acidobacteriota bacterium]MBE3124961.1 PilZ domain-containing protein [Acidobacteriota bacterium]MBE3130789.1 PilZ domain-containing protein [Acidobacteriota bacterium]